VIRAALTLIPYALIAAVSPLAFAATLTVIASGRLKALGFAVGFVTGQIVAIVTLVLIGGVTLPGGRGNHPNFDAVVEIGLGGALLWLAVVLRRRPPAPEGGSSERMKAILGRLDRLHVFTASLAGLMLGIGGPKRLVLTALAAASIAESNQEGATEAALAGWYVVISTALVWAPVLLFIVFGKRAVDKLDAARNWVTLHQRDATFYPLVVAGVVLLLAGAIVLI
jgi:hypothetical protein